MGHAPGSSCSTPAHIGQKYFFAGAPGFKDGAVTLS
jgi:hypothetical protein